MRQNQRETLGSRYLSGGDYHQTVESAVKNKDASDRVKAAQALGLAEIRLTWTQCVNSV